MSQKVRILTPGLICQGLVLEIPIEGIMNNSNFPINDVIVKVDVPAGVQFVSVDLPQGTYDPITAIWNVGTLQSQQVISGTLVYEVIDDCVTPIAFRYVVGSMGSCPDPDTSNNAACVSVEGPSCCQITEKCEENLAQNDVYTVPCDVPYDFNATGNDGVCPAGTAATYEWIELPANGVVVGTPDSATYTANTGFCGVDFATYGILCNGILNDTATVQFNVTCGHGVADVFFTPVDTLLQENVATNDMSCINAGDTTFHLVSDPAANGGGLSEPTDQVDVTVTSWDQLTGDFDLTPVNAFEGIAIFFYNLRCTDPLTGLFCDFGPIPVTVGIPTANPQSDPNSACSGNVLVNDTLCSVGSTTTQVVLGSLINLDSVTLNPFGGYSVVVTDLTLPWSYDYELYCNMVQIGPSATVSGGPITAIAANYPQGPVPAGQYILDLTTGSTPCSEGDTNYQVIGGTEVNVTIDAIDSLAGIVTYTVLGPGPFSFDYNIFCGSCGQVQALATGTVDGTADISSSAVPSSSFPDSSSVNPSSSGENSSSAPFSSSFDMSSSLPVSSSNFQSSSAVPSSSIPFSSSDENSSSVDPSSSADVSSSTPPSSSAAPSSSVPFSSSNPDSSSVEVSSSLRLSSSRFEQSSSLPVGSSSLPVASSSGPEQSSSNIAQGACCDLSLVIPCFISLAPPFGCVGPGQQYQGDAVPCIPGVTCIDSSSQAGSSGDGFFSSSPAPPSSSP